jgi:hypothetical protein
MNNNYYQLYIESVFSLAHTLSVKFDQAALAINDKVMIDYGMDTVDTDNPLSWKYYQNISGAYHFSNPDILITSLDTLEEIPFNKVSLEYHPATKKAYAYGGRYYKDLVSKYPDDELLIKGILYPCDIQTAVSARDGTILSYPAELVDSNELCFMCDLQDWIFDYLDRWVNKQYAVSHDLYVPMYMAQFYMHLVPAIINIRLKSCKTPMAHSFHIRQYLASNGMLDVYLNSLTKEQALFLYRNINYIEANSGKQEIFDWLVENIMTKRGLPFYEYSVKHDVSKMIPTEDNGYSQTDRPSVIFRRLPINYPTVDPKRNIYSTPEMLLRINDQAPGNKQYHLDEVKNIENALVDSKYNEITTKLLESAITDYSEAVPYPLADTLLNEWLSMSTSNRYNAFVTIEFPITKESTTLPAKEAFILFVYCFMKAQGVTLEDLPKVIASRVYKATLPTLSWMEDYFAYSLLTDAQIQNVYLAAPPTTAVSSIAAFYDRCRGVYDMNMQHYYAEANMGHALTTGDLKVANSQLFEDKLIQLTSTQSSYVQWLNSYSYDFDNYDRQDYLDLSVIIFDQATGAAANKSLSIKEIQAAMVSLFTRLSSYSIQVISDAKLSPVFLVPNPGVKVGDSTASVSSNILSEITYFTPVEIRDKDQSYTDLGDLDTNPIAVIDSLSSDSGEIDYSLSDNQSVISSQDDFVYVQISPIDAKGADFNEDYNALTPEEKQLVFELTPEL